MKTAPTRSCRDISNVAMVMNFFYQISQLNSSFLRSVEAQYKVRCNFYHQLFPAIRNRIVDVNIDWRDSRNAETVRVVSFSCLGFIIECHWWWCHTKAYPLCTRRVDDFQRKIQQSASVYWSLAVAYWWKCRWYWTTGRKLEINIGNYYLCAQQFFEEW